MGIRVILASASPRRRELLKLALEEFDVIPADIEEVLPPELELTEGPAYLAAQKARVLAERYPEALIIGCDTGVFIDGKMLGKPKDREDAAGMLRELSGREHHIITGCCLCYQGRERIFKEEASVWMYPISEGEIQSYLDTGEYTDKAGGYAIQGKGALLIRAIQGDYYGIVGLPVARLVREMQCMLVQVTEE